MPSSQCGAAPFPETSQTSTPTATKLTQIIHRLDRIGEQCASFNLPKAYLLVKPSWQDMHAYISVHSEDRTAVLYSTASYRSMHNKPFTVSMENPFSFINNVAATCLQSDYDDRDFH